ncbi:hypothetical protein RD792_001593 [Penstemon davidsonii]|uniref:Nucleotide-diphospho-sugar transferase domain-containing protein n=1 Tax=Penstemon davidsonii TaxID=160366 RepID=A0ABR0DNT9_9LAMI|nr:hypothetical protein RD792_001593 [Penstemon davidsonii]
MNSNCVSSRRGQIWPPKSGGGNLNHDRINRGYFRVLVLFILVTLAACFMFSNNLSEKCFQFLPSSFYNISFSRSDNSNVYAGKANDENSLGSILKKASMKDKKTVIITTLNAAWTEPNSIFDLFLESFRIGNQTESLLKHVVVVALDQKAYSRCLEVHLHCYALTIAGLDHSSGQAHFMSKDYLKMMWRRIDFLRTVLELGYDFVFTDADVTWLRNPFPRFYPDGDFQISCDRYRYNSTYLNNSPNGGFNYVKANNRTVQFYKFWYTGRDYFPGKHDQDVLDMIKFNPFIKEIGLKMRFLDTAYFGGFCQPSKDLDLVITMHANCCSRLESKIHDIKMVIEDWKKYMALPLRDERNLSPRTWTLKRICSYG